MEVAAPPPPKQVCFLIEKIQPDDFKQPEINMLILSFYYNLQENAPQLTRWQRIGQSFNIAGITFFAKMVWVSLKFCALLIQ